MAGKIGKIKNWNPSYMEFLLNLEQFFKELQVSSLERSVPYTGQFPIEVNSLQYVFPIQDSFL